MHTISKSKYMIGLTCPRLFWMLFHAQDKIPPHSESTLLRFDQGREVGTLAKKRYPTGVDLEPHSIPLKIAKTEGLITGRAPIFEAAFSGKGTYCQVDVLAPSGTLSLPTWDIIEVKSSTSVKEEHIIDVAFQRQCLQAAGIAIGKCYLMHLNNEYVRRGPIDPVGIFTLVDITAEVDEIVSSVPEELSRLHKILGLKEAPSPELGTECLAPDECPVCMNDLPPDNVATLYRFKSTAYDLINNGITLIKDIPSEIKLNDKQQIQIECVTSGTPYIDRDAVRGFLKGLTYPLYCMDFEATNPAIPLFDGMRPYQQIPFQVSVHVISASGAVSHIEWLAPDASDPRPGLVCALKQIGPTGTVLAFNKSFEEGRIKELLEMYPSETWLRSLIDRMDDLIVPFRSFWYYDPGQHGSCSMKAVLPALTGMTYSGMEVSKGDQAAREFLDVVWRGNKQGKDVAKLRSALLAYCGQDTEGMVKILEVLKRV